MVDVFKENNINLPSISEADSMDNPLLVAHFTHKSGSEWWIMGGDSHPNNNVKMVLFCMTHITDTEMGTVTLAELESIGAILDTDWKPVGLYDCFPHLL